MRWEEIRRDGLDSDRRGLFERGSISRGGCEPAGEEKRVQNCSSSNDVSWYCGVFTEELVYLE